MEGMLFPRQSETREVMSLDGFWNFVPSPDNDLLLGHRETWFKRELKYVRTPETNILKQRTFFVKSKISLIGRENK